MSRKLKPLLVAAALLALAQQRAMAGEPSGEACSIEAAVPATAVALTEDFDIALDDGRRVALAGLDLPKDESLRSEIRARLSAFLAGGLVFVNAAASAPDRWGRVPARLFAAEGGGPFVCVGEALLEAGLARFRPESAAFACHERALALERRARERGAGLWSRPAYFVIDASHAELFLGLKGMALAEGAVSGTGESRGAIYLNFGKRRGAFAVAIRKKNLRALEEAGVFPRNLAGRRVRVRGLIETGFGPRVEIGSPAEIEILDGAPAP